MIELVKLTTKKLQESQSFVQKYQPINPQDIPDSIQIDRKDQTLLKKKLKSFLEQVDEDRIAQKAQMEKKRQEREREKELKKLEEQGFDTYELRNPQKQPTSKRNIEKEVEELYSSKANEMNIEMGIRSDGRIFNSQQSGGLGRDEKSMFSMFRKQRSKNYHATAEERSLFRDKGLELCYKCSRPGHIARECKYGMN